VYPPVGMTTETKKEKGLHPCLNLDSKYPHIRIVDESQQVKMAIRNVMYEKRICNLHQRKLTERDTDQPLQQSFLITPK